MKKDIIKNILQSKNQYTLISIVLILISIILYILISLVYGYDSYNIFINSEYHTGIPLNAFISDLLLSFLGIVKVIPVIVAIYLVLENHKIGTLISIIYGLTGFLYVKGNYNILFLSSTIITLASFFGLLGWYQTDSRLRDNEIAMEIAAIKTLQLASYFTIFLLIGMILYMIFRGLNYLNFNFIFGKWITYRHAGDVVAGVKEGEIGGILDFIIGSLILTFLAMITATPLGIATAVYLSEYAPDNQVTNTVRRTIETLAGVPSLIMGFVAFGFFGQRLGWGASLATGWIAVTAVILPWVIRVSEEAIMTVPFSYKEASYALGATKWQTIKLVVLRSASPGIITGVLLGVGKSFGEAAVPMLAAGQGGSSIPGGLGLGLRVTNSPWPTLPVWVMRGFRELFSLSSSGTVAQAMWKGQNVVFAGTIVLLAIFLSITLFALFLRNYLIHKVGLGKQ